MPDSNQETAALVREALARKRMSRAALAAAARVSLSSLEKALAGQRPFTDASVIRIEEALGIKLRRQGNGAQHAPDELGSYSRASVAWLEGEYVTLRPSSVSAEEIYAYTTVISWDEAASHLVFKESGRLDKAFTQHGAVSIPHQTGHIYLVTNRHGQHRMAVLARPIPGRDMHGLLTTLQAGKGAQLTPVSMPIMLAPAAQFAQLVSYGIIEKRDEQYRDYLARLSRTMKDSFAIWLGK